MGFLRWVFGKHPVKPVMPPDPKKVAVAGRVAQWQAPMVVALLAERGIRATSAEVSLPDRHAFQPLMAGPSAIIYVMEPDHAKASRFITEFLSAEPATDNEEDGDGFAEFEAQFDDDVDQ